MNNLKVKICGIKEVSILETCIKNNVNFFGLLFYKKSPRFVEKDTAIKLINFSKNKPIIPVGVFVNLSYEKLKKMIIDLKLEYIQLHGNENNLYLKKLKEELNVKIIKTIGLKNKNDLDQVTNFSSADYFLFDYKANPNELPGGNAKSFNWSLLNNFSSKKPWFISGGININNLENITKTLFPYGIDISSGVEETPGIKNEIKIRDLMTKLYEK